jgi:hypothetical protein
MTRKPTYLQLLRALESLRLNAIAMAGELRTPLSKPDAGVDADWRAASNEARDLIAAARDLPGPPTELGDYEMDLLNDFTDCIEEMLDKPRGAQAVLDAVNDQALLTAYDTFREATNTKE